MKDIKLHSSFLLAIVAAVPLWGKSVNNIKISSLSSQSNNSWIVVSGDGKNEALKEIFVAFEKAGIKKESALAEGITRYTLNIGDCFISAESDTSQSAAEYPETDAPQALSLSIPQKDFAYEGAFERNGDSFIHIYDPAIVEALMTTYQKAGYNVEILQLGKKLVAPNLTCVDGILSKNPHISTNCILTVKK